MPEKNYWGIETRYATSETTDPKVDEALSEYFDILFSELKIPKSKREKIAPNPIYIIRRTETGFSVPEKKFFTPEQRQEFLKLANPRLREGLVERSEAVVDYILPHFEGITGSVYDNGAGDKGNAIALKKRFKKMGKDLEIIASDVVRIPGVDKIAPDIPWIYRPANQKHPYKNGHFQASLNVVNFHHSEDPLFELGEIARATDGKVFVVESPANVARENFPEWFISQEHYPELTPEQQSLFVGQIDIAMNNLFLGPEVPVPCNMAEYKTWEKAFELFDLKILHKEFVGYDHPLVREPHILYVLNSHASETSPSELIEIKRRLGVLGKETKVMN